MRSIFRWTASLTSAVLLLLQPLSAFDTPLSDTAVRDAYFLGQRRDGSLGKLLDKYVLYLQPPKTGPYIQSVSFLTPYILTAIYSSEQVSIYSAQQAQLDHLKTPELVRVTVQILLTDSYGPLIAHPANSDPHSLKGFSVRPGDFWMDFRLRTFQKDQMVIPVSAKGDPAYRCDDSGCVLSGATLTFEYLASAFTDTSATIEIDPPEGDPVVVDFDLNSFR
ncbi:MAG TPA: hypothetical protein VFI38_04865 [Candidatus Acidoferrum sp.]|nr:hypothetical protein [Candidatus Acidoferrum sp.]